MQNDSASSGASDEARLREEFGYEQELPRVLKFWTNWAIGFAFISPVVGLFTSFLPSAAIAGSRWVWAVPIVIAGQMLVALSYSGLATRWPIAGGIYQWSKRLVGQRYGWWAGWFHAWAVILSVALTTYTGGIFLGSLLGIDPTPVGNHIILSFILLAIATFVNVVGLRLLKYVVNTGVAAEAVASLAIGTLLLLFFRAEPVHVVWDGAVPGGDSFLAALLAAVSLTAWLIVGFDACGSVAEETENASYHVPRAIVMSVVAVGAVDLLGAFAFTLATPAADFAGDPVSAAVSNAFGEWAAGPFLIVVLISFTACCIATQGAATRIIFSLSRDEQLPGSGLWRKVSGWNQNPTAAVLLVTVLSAIVLTYAQVMTVLVTFTAAAFYLAFLAPVAALLVARLRGRWQDDPETPYSLGRVGNTALNAAAVVWLVFMLVNIGWPRFDDLPWYQNWGALVGMVAFGILGGVYFFISRPYKRGQRLVDERAEEPYSGPAHEDPEPARFVP